MVRVISVHHFVGQHVTTVEQPTASAVAPPDRLLLALSSHCIEVRDLKSDGDVLFTFPTVDEVAQIVHCLNGDYVATMESKFNRQNRELNFVRVYLNWDNVATLQQSKMNSSGASLDLSECGMVQPMRARIAGRVTPTTNQSELGSLEMIEIPTKYNPNHIEVCQISGNILIASNKHLTIYTFQIKTHDISKLKFIDFEELPISIDLSFTPSQIAIAENYIACLNKSSMHMFRINVNTVQNESNSDTESPISFKYNEDQAIDFKKLLNEEKFNLTKDKITVNLPGILRENSAIHRHSPFTFCDRELNAFIKSISPNENKCMNFSVENLIQLQLKPILIENANKQITEEFKCLILKPLYISEAISKNKSESNKLLKSTYRNNLQSISCLIVTQQEGYLYQFLDKDVYADADNCITVYPFTAPVYKIVMEDYFLHALTETGLESYTMRSGHKLCRTLQVVDNVSVACPPVNDPICLVGLRPFLGIEQVLLDESHLVLLANGESSPTHSVGSNSSSTTSYWTLYSLELPTPKTIFNDISIVANSHRFTSTQTYCHLINEAHMILRTSLILNKWTKSESNVTLVKPRRNNSDDICDAYRTSCALLGDHFIMCNIEKEYKLAIPFYKMASIVPCDVIKRVKKIQDQSNSQNVRGLIYYLKIVLFDVKFNTELFGACSKQSFAETVLDLFEKHNFEQLPSLILKVNVLREYNTEKLINILNNRKISCEARQTEKMLALVILYNLKGNVKKSEEILKEISVVNFKTVLMDNWELLFESFGLKKGLSFSEVTIMLMGIHQDLLAFLFLHYINDKKVINLNKLLKVFIEYLPSSIGNDSNQGSMVLQKTLELYFKHFFQKYENQEISKITYDRPTHDAIKLLVRSYLSQLQLFQMKEKKTTESDSNSISSNEDDTIIDSDKETPQEKFKYNKTNKTNWCDKKSTKLLENYLFARQRYEYLNKMPPFYMKIIPENNGKSGKITKNDEADFVLKKLQSLLCSQAVPNQVILEVNAFLALNENLRGNESLQSIIMTINDGVLFLMECSPQCILQYGKDRFTKPDEWKFLIATIQQKILRLSQSEENIRILSSYKKLLKDVLTHVAINMNLEHLILVFPQYMNYSASYIEEDTNDVMTEDAENNTDILKEIQNYEPYITLCKETMHANQIKKLITATGQQLLCTLNL